MAKTEFRIVLRPFRGWNHKYWIQIKLRNWVGIMTWYYVHHVTPHRQRGFKTKAEALVFKNRLESVWNG